MSVPTIARAKTTLKLAKKIINNGFICGLDISSKMTNKALRRIKPHDLTERVNLVLGDAESILVLDHHSI